MIASDSDGSSNSSKRLLRFISFGLAFLWVVGTYTLLGAQWWALNSAAEHLPNWIETMDFVPAYCMGVLAKSCIAHNLNVYDPQNQLTAMNSVLQPYIISKPAYVPYPPYFFVLMIPLTALPLPQAWLLWSGSAALLTVLAAYKLAANYFENVFSRIFIVVLVLACHPVWWAIKTGNAAVWLFPAFVMLWTSFRENSLLKAGLYSAAALIKLQYLPSVFVTGLIRGQSRYLAGISAAAFCLLLPTVFLLGMNNILGFAQGTKIGETPGVYGYNPQLYENIKGSFYLLFGGDYAVPNYLSIAALLGGIAYISWLWKSNKSPVADARINAFEFCAAITILLSLITSPHTYKQDYVLAPLSCIWLFCWINTESCDLSQLRRTSLKVLLCAFPILSWLFFFCEDFFLNNAHIQPYFIWAIATMLVVGLPFRRKPASSSATD